MNEKKSEFNRFYTDIIDFRKYKVLDRINHKKLGKWLYETYDAYLTLPPIKVNTAIYRAYTTIIVNTLLLQIMHFTIHYSKFIPTSLNSLLKSSTKKNRARSKKNAALFFWLRKKKFCGAPATNLPIKSLVSIDRSMVAALLNTTLWPVFKSSTND